MFTWDTVEKPTDYTFLHKPKHKGVCEVDMIRLKSTNRDLESTERKGEGKPCQILPGGNLALMKCES